MRLSRGIRGAAWALVAVGVVAPLVRRRAGLPKPVVLGTAAAAPAALCIAAPKTRSRDIAVCVLQMWAYLAAYEMPNDDPEALRERVRVNYPVRVDTVLGLGEIPSQRLQRAFSRRGDVNSFERVLIWCHWLWFGVPHLALIYVWLRRPQQMTSAAARMYAVFDLGAAVYWLVPTAPPWWAAQHGAVSPASDDGALPVRRIMPEYGEAFWGNRWTQLNAALGGNPLAAMPSLHFATSLMAAQVLSEVDPVAGAAGWAYVSTLGLALVYLGEHYAVDLLAGAALAGTVQRGSRPLGRVLRFVPRGLDRLRRIGESG